MGLTKAGQMKTVLDDEKVGGSNAGVAIVSPQSLEKQAESNGTRKESVENPRPSVEFFFAAAKKEQGKLSSREIYLDHKSYQQNAENVEKTVSSDGKLEKKFILPENDSAPTIQKQVLQPVSYSKNESNKGNLGIRDIAKGMFGGERKA